MVCTMSPALKTSLSESTRCRSGASFQVQEQISVSSEIAGYDSNYNRPASSRPINQISSHHNRTFAPTTEIKHAHHRPTQAKPVGPSTCEKPVIRFSKILTKTKARSCPLQFLMTTQNATKKRHKNISSTIFQHKNNEKKNKAKGRTSKEGKR